MKNHIFKKGKTFYSLLGILMIFTYVPIIFSTIVSQQALKNSHETLSTLLGSALEAQIEYIQQVSPSQNHTEQIEELKSKSFLNILGQETNLEYGPEIVQAEDALLAVTPESKFGDVTTYIYFTKSNYLISSANLGGNSISSVSETALLGLEGFDDQRSDVARVYFYRANEKNENVHSIYTATIFPDVVFIFDIYLPNYMNTERPDMSLMLGFTSSLQNVELCYYDSYGNYRDIGGDANLCAKYDFNTLEGENTNYFSFKTDGEYYLCCYTYNPVNMSKFAIFSKDEIAAEQHKSSVTAWIISIALLCIFMGAAIYYTIKTYKPINNLMDKLGDISPDNKGLKDEFATFNKAIDSYHLQLSDRDKLLSKYYLLRLLHGQSTGIPENFASSWIEASNEDKFMLASLHIDELNENTIFDDIAFEQEIISFMKNAGLDVRTVSDGDFLNIAFRLTNDLTPETVRRCCEKLQASFNELYFSIFLSNAYNNLIDIRRCYNETMKVAEYHIGNDHVGIIDDINALPSNNIESKRSLPDFSLLTKLSDCIVTLSASDALETFDEFSSDIINAGDSSSSNCHVPEDTLKNEGDIQKFSLLKNTIVLAIYDIGMLNNINKESLTEEISSIRNSSSISELREYLSGTITKLSKRVDGQDFYYQRLESVKTFINENYSDPTLDATVIAEKFGMSQSTVTRMFKKYNGTGFLEYIHKIRVDKAIELLKTTDFPVLEISAMVGYTNAATMNRAFKAHAHSTPSMIRKTSD